MNITAIGIDIAKHVFYVHGVNDAGKAIVKKRLYRDEVLLFFHQLKPCIVGLEACCGAHYWAREFRKLGHDVKMMSPQFVKPYVKSNKSDKADAEAICEAVMRPSMRFVSIKSVDQNDLQGLHRVRERLVKARTALANEIRGLMMEYGVTIPKGVGQIAKCCAEVLEEKSDFFTSMSRETFRDLLEEFHELQERLASYDRKLKTLGKAHPVCSRLTTIPGVGPITATAIIAAVGDATTFKNGRQFAAWLGLVPRQHSTGGKERLLGISKRGDSYIRRLLVHGARACLIYTDRHADRRNTWVKQLKERRGTNRAVVALANKNARTIWVLMTRDNEVYRSISTPVPV